MNKKEVVEMFKRDVLPVVKKTYEHNGQKDAIARREAWNNFTDSLCKDGLITSRQYSEWTHPKVCL